MSNLSVNLNCQKIWHNLRQIQQWSLAIGASLVWVTKLFHSKSEVLEHFFPVNPGDNSGVHLGESRLERIPKSLWSDYTWHHIRLFGSDDLDLVLATGAVSTHSQFSTLRYLDAGAKNRNIRLEVMLSVDTGDRREGLFFHELPAIIEFLRSLPHLKLRGITTNHGCFSGSYPDISQFQSELEQVESLRVRYQLPELLYSIGGSSDLKLLLPQKVNASRVELRLGEAWLLGTDPATQGPIPGLMSDTAEVRVRVLEAKEKSHQPEGAIHGSNAFAETVSLHHAGSGMRLVLAIGRQDCDVRGLIPPTGTIILGASSDYLILWDPQCRYKDAEFLSFKAGYLSLMGLFSEPSCKITLQTTD